MEGTLTVRADRLSGLRRSTQPPKARSTSRAAAIVNMVAVAAGGDLNPERQPGLVEADGDLGHGHAEKVEQGHRRQHPRAGRRCAVARGDARERRMEEDAVADRLLDLLGELASSAARRRVHRAGT